MEKITDSEAARAVWEAAWADREAAHVARAARAAREADSEAARAVWEAAWAARAAWEAARAARAAA
jgi:hypothetical protein